MISAILGYLASVLFLVPIVLFLVSRHATTNEYINRISYQMIGVLSSIVICIVWICIKPSAWWALLVEQLTLICFAYIGVMIYKKR